MSGDIISRLWLLFLRRVHQYLVLAAEALRMYDQAVAAAPTDATLRSNRAAARLAAGLYQDAIMDAQAAVTLDRTYAKGYYRCSMNTY